MTSKGQITIPKAIRDALHLDVGDRISFSIREDGVVEMRPENVDLRDLVGALKSGRKRLSVEDMDEVVSGGAAEK